MGVLRNIIQPRSTLTRGQAGGSVRPLTEVDPSLPVQHRKRAVFKPIEGESTSKRFSNPNKPMVVYDSKPLEQTLEELSFKSKIKQKKGMGVKLVL